MSFKFNNPDDQKRFDELFFECGNENLAAARLNYEKVANDPNSTQAMKTAALNAVQKIEKENKNDRIRNGAMIHKEDLQEVYEAVFLGTGLAMGELLFDKFPDWLEIHNQIEDRSQAIYKTIISKADDIQQVRQIIAELKQNRR